MIARRLITSLIGILSGLIISSMGAQERVTVTDENARWIEIAPNELWIRVDPNSNKPITIKLRSFEDLQINDDNPLIVKDGYKMTQFRPTENFQSHKVNPENSVYEIEANFSGNLTFIRDNKITEIVVTTTSKEFSFDISKRIALTLEKLCSNVNNLNFYNKSSDISAIKNEPQSRLVSMIVEKNSYLIPNKTPQTFSIEFYRQRRGDSSITLEGKEKVEVTLIQLENIVNTWKNYSDSHYIYDCKITKEE